MSGTLAVTEVLFVAGVFVFTAALTAMNGGYFPTSWPPERRTRGNDCRLRLCACDPSLSGTGRELRPARRRSSTQHLLVDAGGLPLAWTLTGGNR